MTVSFATVISSHFMNAVYTQMRHRGFNNKIDQRNVSLMKETRMSKNKTNNFQIY